MRPATAAARRRHDAPFRVLASRAGTAERSSHAGLREGREGKGGLGRQMVAEGRALRCTVGGGIHLPRGDELLSRDDRIELLTPGVGVREHELPLACHHREGGIRGALRRTVLAPSVAHYLELSHGVGI